MELNKTSDPAQKEHAIIGRTQARVRNAERMHALLDWHVTTQLDKKRFQQHYEIC